MDLLLKKLIYKTKSKNWNVQTVTAKYGYYYLDDLFGDRAVHLLHHYVRALLDTRMRERLIAWKHSMQAERKARWARRVEDILAGFGEFSKKPADLGSIPSESAIFASFDSLFAPPSLAS